MNAAKRQARVLVVEDSKTCREHLVGRLRLRPCKAFVVGASTLRQAVEHLRDQQWDLVVLDLDLAGESGEKLLPHIQPGTTVVWCTAAPERAPTTHRTIRKGPRWVIDIESVVLALPI